MGVEEKETWGARGPRTDLDLECHGLIRYTVPVVGAKKIGTNDWTVKLSRSEVASVAVTGVGR
jgi:hypothetical protein